MNLIIIDDDPFVTGALKILLEANPNITVLASGSNGKEAVSLYHRHRPDILLMDIRMEEMDGLTASEQILQEYPDAKILLLTTFSDDEYIIKALLSRCQRVSSKAGLCHHRSSIGGRCFRADRLRK